MNMFKYSDVCDDYRKKKQQQKISNAPPCQMFVSVKWTIYSFQIKRSHTNVFCQRHSNGSASRPDDLNNSQRNSNRLNEQTNTVNTSHPDS
jgi:hypothetical protein